MDTDSQESLERFTFWRSYDETISLLDEEEGNALLRAIVRYGLDGEEPDKSKLTKSQLIAWTMIVQSVKSTRAKAIGGRRGGKHSPSMVQASAKHDESMVQASAKHDASTITKTKTKTKTNNEGEKGEIVVSGSF